MHGLARTALVAAAALTGVLATAGIASADTTGADCARIGLRCEVVDHAGNTGILISPAGPSSDPNHAHTTEDPAGDRTTSTTTRDRGRGQVTPSRDDGDPASDGAATTPTDDPTTAAPSTATDDPSTDDPSADPADGATARDDDGREDADTGITAADRPAAPDDATTDDPGDGTEAGKPAVDLAQWSLTLPTGKQGHPDTVKPADLAATANDDFHRTDDGRGLVLSARADGVTTGGSDYPRSELREVDGDRDAAWTNTRGTHTLDLREAVTAVPKGKPEVVAAQIHDGHDDVIQVRLEGAKLLVAADDGKTTRTLDPAYKLGTPYRVRIVAADSRVTVQYNDEAPVTLPLSGTGWYFKVGAYVQANGSQVTDPSTTGEVTVYSATVTHDGAPASADSDPKADKKTDTGTGSKTDGKADSKADDGKDGKGGKDADEKDKKSSGTAMTSKAAPKTAPKTKAPGKDDVVNDGAADPALGDGRAQTRPVERTAYSTPGGGEVTGHATGDSPAGAHTSGTVTTLPGAGQYAGLPDGVPAP